MNKEAFRVTLRALEINDHLITQSWRHDEAYQASVVTQKRCVSLETEKRWIESVIKNHEDGREVRLGIVLRETEELIGLIYLININYVNRNANVGSIIGSPEHRKKGYIQEARRLIFEYGFKELGLERISATILENNLASRRSGEKFGYVQEGIQRNAIFKNGCYRNLILYSMLKEEFFSKYGTDE